MPHNAFSVTRTLRIVALSIAAIFCSSAVLGQSVRAQAASPIQSAGPALSFRSGVAYSAGEPGFVLWGQSNTVAISDLNGDGHPDLIIAVFCDSNEFMACPYGLGTGKVSVLLNNGHGTFQPALIYNTGGFFAIAVLVADINGDNKPDLIVANGCTMHSGFCPNDGSVGVLLGNGDGTFQPVQTDAAGGVPWAIAVADVNKDGSLDVIVANAAVVWNTGEGSVGVLLGTGTGAFQAVRIYRSGGMEPNFVVVADVNHDSKPDVLVSNFQQCQNCVANLGVLLGNGDGTFQPVATYTAAGGGSGLVVADMNGDGILDVILNEGGIFYGGVFSVFLGNGDGTFQPGVMYATGGGYNFLPVVADLNEDQKLDVIAPVLGFCPGFPHGYGCVSVLLGNGDGTLQSPAFYSANGGAAWAAVNDLNGDAIPDIAFVGAGRFLGVLQGNGDGSFQPAQFYQSGGYDYSTWVGVADLNGDGEPDLVVEYPKQNNLSLGVFLNNSAPGTPTGTGLTSSPNPTTYGQKVTFMAQVTTSGPVPPTGTVVFMWKYLTQTYTIGTATLNSAGVATLTKSNLNANLNGQTYPMIAVYRGDVNNLNSTSAVLNQTVLQTTSKATLTSTPNPSTVGQAVTFRATITSPTVTAMGPVTFTLGRTTLGTAQLSGGKATFTTSSLPPGSNVVKVTYLGNSNIAKSSAVVTQAVQP